MKALVTTFPRRLGWAFLLFSFLFAMEVWLMTKFNESEQAAMPQWEFMARLLTQPLVMAAILLVMLTGCASRNETARLSELAAAAAAAAAQPARPFMAQVVGLQWLNPLQRRDYPTEWEILWTLGLVRPNSVDYQVKTNPKKFTSLQPIGIIANGNDGRDGIVGFHEKYWYKFSPLYRSSYFADPNYFYNVHTTDKKLWRELAGIRIEYAIPDRKDLDPAQVKEFVTTHVASYFEIGSKSSPTLWSRDTPPDVHVTTGGPNAGFRSLAAGLDHLRAHPAETVWVMNWDAPSHPLDEQMNENIALLILAGPDFKTERAALAWIGYPASKSVNDHEAQKGESRIVRAWKDTLDAAAANARKVDTDIGYVIHDADISSGVASDRLGSLAGVLHSELIEFDYFRSTFNTPALLGDMGAGTALTNVVLAIGYANHIGKVVLVAGTTDPENPTAVLVVPPEKIRPIDPTKDWFRARGENNAYLPWWGLRNDIERERQGYSK